MRHYIIASIGNAYDLIASLIMIKFFGYTEANAWVRIIHNSIISLLMGILVFQLIATIILIISMRVRIVAVMNTSLGLFKIILISLNIINPGIALRLISLIRIP